MGWRAQDAWDIEQRKADAEWRRALPFWRRIAFEMRCFAILAGLAAIWAMLIATGLAPWLVAWIAGAAG